MENQFIKQNFHFTVDTAGSSTTAEFELDKNIDKVIGLALTSKHEDLLYHRGNQGIWISEVEIFREGHESRMLMSGIGVPPNDRYYKIEPTCAGNHKLTVRFTDEEIAATQFDPYRVTVYVLARAKHDES